MARVLTLLCSLLLIVTTAAAPASALGADTATQSKSETNQASNGAKKEAQALVPVFSLDSPITESSAVEDPLFGGQGAETTKELVARLEKARDDKDVKAIVVLIGNNLSLGFGQLEEIHNALREIRDAGKPVYAHVDSLSFGRLVLLSAASRISVAPVGDLFITGIYGEQPHLRHLLDKIHVTPDFITCGAYKSAGEMFMRSEPSPEAKRMYDWLFDSIYSTCIDMIADGRQKTREEVRGWVDKGLYSAEEAQKLGIIDAAECRADLLSKIKKEHGENVKLPKKYGKQESDTLDLSSPLGVFKLWADLLGGSKKAQGKTSVAIVYVDGPIVPGSPEPSPFGSQGVAYSNPIRKALDDAAEDDSVKAVVLRVDSPGGSAVASEIILQATKRVAEKKPLIVSMGNVAGSGGYYVSCGAKTIVADAGTITASIGVVAGKLATKEMWESIGVNWHPIERGKNSGMLQSGEVFTPEQKENLQNWMNEVYDVFKGHVVAIRGDRLTKPIDEVAGGRVYTGRQALELGLVDRIGTLRDTIELAAKEAQLEEGKYEVRVIPKPKNIIEMLLGDLAETKEEDEKHLELDGSVRKSLQTQSLWDAAANILQRVEPIRATAVRRALIQLEILQRDGVSLAMPEIVIAP